MMRHKRLNVDNPERQSILGQIKKLSTRLVFWRLQISGVIRIRGIGVTRPRYINLSTAKERYR